MQLEQPQSSGRTVHEMEDHGEHGECRETDGRELLSRTQDIGWDFPRGRELAGSWQVRSRELD